MKHLLIILISFLLLSSPLFGEETGVLYQYETSTGIKWKTFGDGKVQPKYKGEIKNGKMDGLGVLTYPYNEKSVVGEWKNGKEWNTKHKNKDGTLIGKYENGEWIGGLGVLYLGMRNGVMGYYQEKWEGEESEENRDYGKYEGEIKNGKQNGQGTYTQHVGIKKKYVGKWKNGWKHGQGTETLPNGNKYVGKWKDGKEHGQGTLTLPNGNKYEGEYKDGKWDGQGTFTWIKGDKYVGEWKNGKQNGQGRQTWSDGGKFVGEHRGGLPWNGIIDKNGNIIYKFENGKRIKQ